MCIGLSAAAADNDRCLHAYIHRCWPACVYTHFPPRELLVKTISPSASIIERILNGYILPISTVETIMGASDGPSGVFHLWKTEL